MLILNGVVKRPHTPAIDDMNIAALGDEKFIVRCLMARWHLLVGGFGEDGISHHHVLHEIASHLRDNQWANAAPAFTGKGLETGTPNLGPASKAYSS